MAGVGGAIPACTGEPTPFFSNARFARQRAEVADDATGHHPPNPGTPSLWIVYQTRGKKGLDISIWESGSQFSLASPTSSGAKRL